MTLTQSDLLNLENAVKNILKDLTDCILAEFQKPKEVFLKNNLEPFTKFEVQMEEEIRNKLNKLLPIAGFIVEEGKTAKLNSYNWVIDPIDQTKNFIAKLPLFYTQVALTYNDLPILGVIYNPVSNQLFSASLGNGTKLNNELVIRCQPKPLEKSIIDIDLGGANGDIDWKAEVIKKIFKNSYRIRITGGSFSPYLLTCAIDGLIAIGEPKIVDKMPRIILAQEAGFSFETFEFKNHPIYFMGSQSLFEEVKTRIFRL